MNVTYVHLAAIVAASLWVGIGIGISVCTLYGTLGSADDDSDGSYRRVVREYRSWMGAMPDIARVLDNLAAEAEGKPLNSETPSGLEDCTVQGLRQQVEQIRVGLAIKASRRLTDDETRPAAAFSSASL